MHTHLHTYTYIYILTYTRSYIHPDTCMGTNIHTNRVQTYMYINRHKHNAHTEHKCEQTIYAYAHTYIFHIQKMHNVCTKHSCMYVCV